MFHVEQANFIRLDACPVCGSAQLTSFLKVKDHTYSKLDFNLDQCLVCGFTFTNPRPVESENGNYYKSADYISHTNSTKGIIGSLYKRVRNINLKRKIKVLKKHQSGKNVLDIGSGTGFFPAAVNKAGYKAIGVEPDETARKFSIETNKIEAYPLEELAKFNRQFDTITMWHVLEHVYHLKDQLKTIAGLCKPGGLFIIAVPNYKSFDASHYKEHWAGYDVPRHLYHFEEKTIQKLLAEFDFTLEDVVPMKFDAYYVSMLSEKYKGGSMLKAVFKGRKSNALASSKKTPFSSQIYVFKNKQ